MANGQTLASTLNRPVDPFSVIGQISRGSTTAERGRTARQQEESFLRGQSEAEAAAQREEAAAKKQQIDKEQRIESEYVSGLERQAQEFKTAQEGMPTRQVTEFDAQAATELATLTAIMGAFAGSISGRAGLAAMQGVSDGYLQGRQDLYERELKVYEDALNEYKTKVNNAKEIYDNAVRLETAKRGAGLIELKKLEPLLQDSVIAAHARKRDFTAVGKSIEEAKRLEGQLETALSRAAPRTPRLTTIMGTDASGRQVPMVVDVNQYTPTGDAPTPTTAGVIGEAPPKAAQAGVRERSFALRTFTALRGVTEDFRNLLLSPATSAMPALSGLIARDADTVIGSLTSLAARQITPEEERAFQQLTEQIAASLARIEAQGLASGTTQANVRSFDALRPRAGDSAINMALYLARLKQEIEIGVEVFETNTGANERQIEIAKGLMQKVDELIPFEVEDVLRQLPGGQQNLSQSTQRLLRQVPIFDTLQDVQPQQGAAPQQPQTGKTATMGNVRATARNRGISEEEARNLYIQRGYSIKD